MGQDAAFDRTRLIEPAAGANGTSTAALSRPNEIADLLWSQYGFLVSHGIAEQTLDAAIAKAVLTGTAPHLVLIADGHLGAQQYLSILQAVIARQPMAPAIGGVTEALDAISQSPAVIAAAAQQVRARGGTPLLMSPDQLDWCEPENKRVDRAHRAANGLLKRMPTLSAGSRVATWQIVLACALIGTPIGGLAIIPDTAFPLIAGLMAFAFLLIVGLRLWALVIMLVPQPRRREPRRLPDTELPVYSILVPLFREADVLPGLVTSLSRLDYPPEKLDILLVLESVDSETQAAARALALPRQFRIVVVPDLQPRTKPKALNYALELTRGAYVVVYDAEDDPEPDQLRRALAEFRRRPRGLMCVQAKLAMESAAPGFLERQFTLEYAALFDAMLPAIVKLGLPVPLGGTSNHFPRAVLDRLGGWDAYNVTEDADLGVRIARLGGRVTVLDSTTYEEPPDALGVWMRQRTRWLKGFMMTWLVHMRRPARLMRELGLWGFIGFNAFLGGIVLSALIHPLFVAYLLYAVLSGELMKPPETMLGGALILLAAFNFVAGYASGMALAALAASRRGLVRLLPRILLMPLYWLLISAAAYRAAVQLVANPYLWEKTPHAARGRGRQ